MLSLSLSLVKLLTCGVIGVIRSYNVLSLFLKHCRKQNIHVSPKKNIELACAQFHEPHQRGIWWCCKATFKKIHCWSYNLFKRGSMSRCGYSKARPWFGNISSETCGHFSVCLACAKKKCGFVGPASPSIWITGAHCAAPAKFWITDYNICELLDFHNRGPFDRIFGQTKAKKHKIKKTIDFQKPLPQNLRKRWNV